MAIRASTEVRGIPRVRAVARRGIQRAGRPVAAWLAFFVAHLWLVGPLIQNGDCAVYNDQIEHRIVNFRTSHVGYMLLGMATNAVLPFDLDRNMNLMCLAFASGGAVALMTIARKQGASRGAALFAALLAFATHAYLRGAVLSEVDVVACSLVLLGLAAWVSRQRVFAAAAYGLAMLVTPVTATTLPMFLLTRASGERGLRPRLADLKNVAIFGAVAIAVYAPLVLLLWHDYCYGGRGLLHAPRIPWGVDQQVARSVRFLTGSAAPWLAVGLGSAFARILDGTSLGVGVLAAMATTAVLGERTLDVPVQLPNLCVLGVFVVLLADRLPQRKMAWSALTAVWALTAWPTYRDVEDEVSEKRERRATYQEMAAQTPKMLVAGLSSDWEEGLAFGRIVYRNATLGFGFDYGSFRRSAASIAGTRKGYAIWLLTPAPPGTMAPFLSGWRRDQRVVRGRSYEVWLPNETS
jgi:hypothetical protein